MSCDSSHHTTNAYSERAFNQDSNIILLAVHWLIPDTSD